MSSNHVPLLLGSYKATLSKCDRLIFQVNRWSFGSPSIVLDNYRIFKFQLLRWYEDNGIRFSDCRPYLWGDAAVTHHSIRTEISVSLKRQPLPTQVIELLDDEIVKNTVRYFPLDRSLQVGRPCRRISLNVRVLYKFVFFFRSSRPTSASSMSTKCTIYRSCYRWSVIYWHRSRESACRNLRAPERWRWCCAPSPVSL